jgi:hypothetical protein
MDPPQEDEALLQEVLIAPRQTAVLQEYLEKADLSEILHFHLEVR